jgi:hypothetical protein
MDAMRPNLASAPSGPGRTTRIAPRARSSLKGSVLDVNQALADSITCDSLGFWRGPKCGFGLTLFEFLLAGKMGRALPHFG